MSLEPLALLAEAYELSAEQWMVPCLVDRASRRFIPLARPVVQTGDQHSKVPWSTQEDVSLLELIASKGVKKWTAISKQLNKTHHSGELVRHAKQCRERWFNHLDPELKRTDWTLEEDEFIIKKQKLIGNKWSHIARELPGRTEHSVKNRWKSIKRKAFSSFDCEDRELNKVEAGGEIGGGEGSYSEQVNMESIGHTFNTNFGSFRPLDDFFNSERLLSWHDPGDDIYTDFFA